MPVKKSVTARPRFQATPASLSDPKEIARHLSQMQDSIYQEVARLATKAGIPNGVAFPSMKGAYDLFFRTDQGVIYYYSGTAWLPVSPAQFFFGQLKTTVLSAAKGPGATVVAMETNVSDPSGLMVTTGAACKLTAPEAGIYALSASLLLDTNTTAATSISAYMTGSLQGVVAQTYRQTTIVNELVGLSLSAVVRASAGETFNINAQCGAGTFKVDGASNPNIFSIARLA